MYSLSSSQRAIWLDQVLHAEAPLYNIGCYAKINSAINPELFEQALRQVIQANDALRIVLHNGETLPTQSILAQIGFKLDVHDCFDEQQALSWMARAFVEPFPLYEQVLFQFALLRVSERQYYLFSKYHHVIIDTWGMLLVLQQIAKAYQMLSQSQTDFHLQAFSYLDFLQDDQDYFNSEAYHQDQTYWLDRYATLPEPLISHRSISQSQAASSGRSTLMLERTLYNQLAAFAQTQQTSVFRVMLGVLYCYFMRVSGSEDFVMGLPKLNRNTEAFKQTVGLFTNISPVRFDFSAELNFVELLQIIRERLKKDYKQHQRFPLQALHQQLDLSAKNHQWLFDVSLSYMNFKCDACFEGVPAEVIVYANDIVQNALTVFVYDIDDDKDIRIEFGYNSNAFEASEIELIKARFAFLLGEILRKPEVPLRELQIMPEAERHKLLVEWNNTQTDYPKDKCIHQLFEEQVEKTPEAIAVVFEDQQLTYRQLNAKANQLAHYLRTLGVGPEVLVGICVERSLEMVIGILGILKAGGAYVPLDPGYPQKCLNFIVEDARLPIVLTQEKLESFEQVAKNIKLDSDWEIIAKESEKDPINQTNSDNLVYVIYTSGSTGKPKGVEIQHNSLANLISWHQNTYGITTVDKATQIAATSFDASVWELWPYIIAGASIYIPSEEVRVSPSALIKWLTDKAITISFLPTPLAEAILEQPLPAHLNLRNLLTGGDKLHRLPNKVLPFAVVNHYGPTENTVVTTQAVATSDKQVNASPPIGSPIANTQVYVLNAHLQQTPIGVPGELYIGGVGLARGYLNRPELTKERFIANPFDAQTRLYKTGDLVRYLPNGNLEFLGRIDHQVKIRGFRIELGEIEAVLHQHSLIQETAVAVREDIPNDKQLVAYLVIKQQPVSIAELRNFLKERLPNYMVPSAFVLLESLPLTPNGKIDRQALPKPERFSEENTSYVAPQSKIEQAITEIWQAVLHLDKISIHENFFDLGGNSLLIVQVHEKIKKELSYNIPIAVLFQYSTISTLSNYLEQLLKSQTLLLINYARILQQKSARHFRKQYIRGRI